MSAFCHSHDVALIIASTKGLFGQIFCDFGENFEVVDSNGETPVSAMVAGITKEVRQQTKKSTGYFAEHGCASPDITDSFLCLRTVWWPVFLNE